MEGNREIIREFKTAMNVSGWEEVMRILKASERLLQDTLEGGCRKRGGWA